MRQKLPIFPTVQQLSRAIDCHLNTIIFNRLLATSIRCTRRMVKSSSPMTTSWLSLVPLRPYSMHPAVCFGGIWVTSLATEVACWWWLLECRYFTWPLASLQYTVEKSVLPCGSGPSSFSSVPTLYSCQQQLLKLLEQGKAAKPMKLLFSESSSSRQEQSNFLKGLCYCYC